MKSKKKHKKRNLDISSNNFSIKRSLGKKVVSLYLPVDLVEWLDANAEAQKMSRSELITFMLNQGRKLSNVLRGIVDEDVKGLLKKVNSELEQKRREIRY
ncbi:MAG: ribbon-helix-helix protein, CopG family [Candidatus Hodarchaeota archaeon]